MKRLMLILLIVFPGTGRGLEPAADPALAVVRIKSHGASGIIIRTMDGKSWILSCCHMFFDNADRLDQRLLSKKIVIDGPPQPQAKRGLAEVRVIATDPYHDLSLLEIDNGPFHYIPVAAQGFKPGRNLSSAGYDSMKWPITQQQTTILITLSDWTYTREKPYPGRSGGGLFDVGARRLIGVVNGFETAGQQRGIYVSHDAVVAFMSKHGDRIGLLPVPGFKQANPLLCPT